MIVTNALPALPTTDFAGAYMPMADVSGGLDFAALLTGPPLLPVSTASDARAIDPSRHPLHPTSFEALALIERVALDLSDAAAGDLVEEVQEEQDTGAAIGVMAIGAVPIDAAAIGGFFLPISAVVARPAGSSPNSVSPPPQVAPQALPRVAPQQAAPLNGSHGESPAASPLQVASAQGRETQSAEAPRATASAARPQAAVDAVVFALGAGITIHLGADEARPRVAVRGLRLDAADRGEAAGRIVKLMRAYGYDISEHMIDFEGVGQ